MNTENANNVHKKLKLFSHQVHLAEILPQDKLQKKLKMFKKTAVGFFIERKPF